jgi:hypothetical protein
MGFLWDEPKRRPTGVKCCRKGHDLYWDNVSSRCESEQRLACDVCGKHISHPYRTAACAKCNFDLCAKCYAKWEEPDRSKPAAPSSSADFKILSFFLPSCAPTLGDTASVVSTNSTDRETRIVEFTNADRYNKVRPKFGNSRVSYFRFPDPEDYGWLLTGSSRKMQVSFYERVVDGCFVKLDFHYATGTIRTLLERPSLGATVLFQARGDELPAVAYQEILRNPLSHSAGNFHASEEEEEDSIKAAIDDDDSVYQLEDKIAWARMR